MLKLNKSIFDMCSSRSIIELVRAFLLINVWQWLMSLYLFWKPTEGDKMSTRYHLTHFHHIFLTMICVRASSNFAQVFIIRLLRQKKNSIKLWLNCDEMLSIHISFFTFPSHYYHNVRKSISSNSVMKIKW